MHSKVSLDISWTTQLRISTNSVQLHGKGGNVQKKSYLQVFGLLTAVSLEFCLGPVAKLGDFSLNSTELKCTLYKLLCTSSQVRQ